MIQDLTQLIIDFLSAGRWVYVLLALGGAFVIYDTIRFLNSKEKYRYTVGVVGRLLGYIIYITGAIRAGKSSVMNGMSHAIQEHLLADLHEKLQHVQLIINEIDYNVVNDQIMAMYQSGLDVDTIFDTLKEFYASDLLRTYDNGLTVESHLDLFFVYIYSFCRILDNNFVMSTQPVLSRITGTQAKVFDTSWMDVKVQAETTGVYAIERYNVIMEDDQNMNSKKESHNHYTIAKEDAGKDLWMRTFGHLYKETCYYLTTMQSAERIVKVERELTTSVIFVEGFDLIELRYIRLILNIVRLLIGLLYKAFLLFRFPWPFRYKKLQHEGYRVKVDRRLVHKQAPSVWRKLDFFMLRLQELLFAHSYLRFKLRRYSKPEEVGRNNSANMQYYDPLVLHFPTRYCFGVADTHAFSFLHDLLKKRSSMSYHDVAEHVAFLSSQAMSPEDIAALAQKGEDILKRNKSGKEAASNVVAAADPVDY